MINNSYLLGLFGGASDFSTLTGAAALPPMAVKKSQPTPPWDPKASVPEPSALVRAALAGRRIINEGAAQLDVPGASADYRKLFALYQGLDSLSALAERAGTRGVSASEQAQIAKHFAAGLAELSGYLQTASLDGVRVVQGTSSATSKTTAGVARDSAQLITAAIHQGALTSPVAAFEGDVAFDITIKRLSGDVVVSVDLADMGSQPRTLDAVNAYINDKLQAAGVDTRFGRQQVNTEPRTVKVGDKTVTLPTQADQWALSVKGTIGETVKFTAAQTSDAVYVVQGAGATGGHQLLKFQSDGGSAPEAEARVGETYWVEGRASQTALPDGVSAVRASATGPDGSLWIVADLDTGPANQPIKGQRDVALMKYDSAGNLVTTQTLGAASTASGYAISVSDDGRVAVAGSVTGGLDLGDDGDAAGVADSFVTVFDSTGAELWTQRRGARAADEATSVSFGADGKVYVAGRAQSGIPGTVGVGGWDGYLQTFTATEASAFRPASGVATGASQFGTAGDDGVQAMTVDGSNLYTAGVENGHAVVRRFTLDAAGQPTLASTRDLGLASGDIAGVAVSGGQVIVTGTTRNSSLDAGTVNRAHSGGTDAYVAVLSTDLAAGASDRLTYYGTAGDDTAADVKVADGKVWITGVSDRPAGAKDTDPTRGYLARLDPLTGAMEWSQNWAGDGLQAAPSTVAIASGGASVLDRLGLPQGEIFQEDSKLLTAATSLRVGDRFYISPADGGRAVAVTIDAKDTLQTLARKIQSASNNKLKVTVVSDGGYVTGREAGANVTAGGFQHLSIVAQTGRAGAVLSAGEPGRDALAGLGLSSGFVGPTSGDDALKTYGLDLPLTLNLSGADAIKAANDKLTLAMTAIRSAYRSLSPEAQKPAVTGTVPAYLSAQIANYQAALARLTG